MRLREFTSDSPDIVETIRHDCSDFLSQANRPLYRGVENFPKNVYLNVEQRDRSRLGHEYMIELCVDHHLKRSGIAAMRLNSAFCTDETKYASQYGEVFYVFPKNGFPFAYGSTRDLYPTLERWLRRDAADASEEMGYSRQVRNMILDATGDLGIFSIYLKRSPTMRKMFEQLFLKNYGFSDTNLSLAMDQHSEIWFSGGYHLVKVDSDEGKKISTLYLK
jgi:hypothetical protein